MKCFFCDNEASGICIRCGRGICKDHGKLTSEEAAMPGKLYFFWCLECVQGSKQGMQKGTI